ncbi:MAG: V-type ATP synthase subunit F [Candidatus Brocadiales bacterium]
MFKVVAVGEKDLIIGFKAVGVELVPVKSPSEVDVVLEKLSQDTSVGLILITETIAEECLDVISSFRDESPVVILIVPSHLPTKHISMLEMKRDIEKAVGVDMLSKS